MVQLALEPLTKPCGDGTSHQIVEGYQGGSKTVGPVGDPQIVQGKTINKIGGTWWIFRFQSVTKRGMLWTDKHLWENKTESVKALKEFQCWQPKVLQNKETAAIYVGPQIWKQWTGDGWCSKIWGDETNHSRDIIGKSLDIQIQPYFIFGYLWICPEMNDIYP
jgi:hypothetical protein